MASFSSTPFGHFFIFITILTTNTLALPKFKSIISFGDSLADTGNLAHFVSVPPSLAIFLRLPYGETFFGRPTGRWSNGRLVIDFMAAQDFGLPFIPPFLRSCIYNNTAGCSTSGFQQGVNFAVAGATALGQDFFDRYGVKTPFPNASLAHQLNWFKHKFLPVFCSQLPECKTYLEEALFLVGEIGGNDYNDAFFQAHKTIDVIQQFVPHVVKAIGSAVTELIQLGARTLMVPGNFPIGCTSKYLTAFQTSDRSKYDTETGCLKWLNEFSEYHNKALKSELSVIQAQNPKVTIIYADNYGASMHLYRNPTKYGFSKLGGLYSCCGGKGPYNISLTVTCGQPGTYTCPDPSKYVCWDGLHYTDAASRHITTLLLHQSFAGPGPVLSGLSFDQIYVY